MGNGSKVGMTMRSDLDEIHRALLTAFPPLSVRAQHASVALYRLLIERRVVRREQLASTLGVPTRDVVATLEEPGMRCEVMYDDAARVVGFLGLGSKATSHCLTIDDQQVFTWCAWDALFIPVLLDISADLVSTSPPTGQTIHVSVNKSGATSAGDPVLSFLEPNPDECARSIDRSIACFCAHVNLFGSVDAGATWIADRPGAFLLSLEDAFRLGRRHVATRFEAVMSRDLAPRVGSRS